MSGGGSPPNPAGLALAQYGLNRQAAADSQRMNMISQDNPFGSLNYAEDKSSPSGFRATMTLDPAQQGILDQQNKRRLGAGTLANTLLGSGGGALSGQPLKLGWSDTEARINALNRNTLDPQWQQNQDELDAKLYARGVRPGSSIYDSEMRNFGEQKSDAYNSMYLKGHDTAVNDIMKEYYSPLETFSVFNGLSQPTMPNSSFVSTPGAQFNAPDFAGMANNAYQQQQANNSARMGGIFGLAGTLTRGAFDYFSPKYTSSPAALRAYNGQAEWNPW